MKVYFTTRLSNMSHYETHAGPWPCILECFQKEYRLQISHRDFVHRLDVPSQMQPPIFKPCTLNPYRTNVENRVSS